MIGASHVARPFRPRPASIGRGSGARVDLRFPPPPPVLFLLAATMWLLLLPGCLKQGTVVQQGNREQILHRNLGYEITGLDPHLVTGIAETAVLDALFEGLVSEDPVDLHPVPGVAERWDISPDGLTYTFFLRADARWSNGEPVTAADFVASYRRILTPSLGADYASLFYALRGAEAFHKGLTHDFASVGVAAPDARTLRLTLDHPTAYFLTLLTQIAWRPVPIATIEKYGSPYERGTDWTRPGRLVGNGPFTLKTWRPNQVIVVEKSPTYWDAATVRLQAIHFHPIDSVDTEERSFRAGQLHITDSLPIGKIDSYRHDAPQFLRIDPYLGTYYYLLNTTRPPLNDVRIRRALSLAVDREAIVNKILHGGQQPAFSFTPPGTAGYQPPSRFAAPASMTAALEAARQLLKDAGFEGGKGLPPIELLYPNSENHRLLAEAVQEMWRRELGIDVRLANQELKVTFASRRTGAFQILRASWIGDYLDPSTFLDVFRSDSGNNFSGWSSPAYDAALFAAARTPDPAARNALFQQAESLLLDAAPIIPIYFYTHVFLIQPSVKGWHPTLLDHHPYKYVWLEP